MIKDKGIDELLDIIPDIKKYPNVKFKIIGQIDKNNPRTINQKRLFSLAKKGLIEYDGFKSDLRNDYKKATCLISPSYREDYLKR